MIEASGRFQTSVGPKSDGSPFDGRFLREHPSDLPTLGRPSQYHLVCSAAPSLVVTNGHIAKNEVVIVSQATGIGRQPCEEDVGVRVALEKARVHVARPTVFASKRVLVPREDSDVVMSEVSFDGTISGFASPLDDLRPKVLDRWKPVAAHNGIDVRIDDLEGIPEERHEPVSIMCEVRLHDLDESICGLLTTVGRLGSD